MDPERAEASPADAPETAATEQASAPAREAQDGAEKAEPKSASAPARRSPRKQTRRPPANNDLKGIQRQIQEIVDSLQQALEEMESAQRLLAQVDVERQEDLSELSTLRKTLDQFQGRRHESRSRSRNAGSSS